MQTRTVILLLLLSHSLFALQSEQDSRSAFAELLYWKMSEVGADNWAQVVSPAAPNQSIQFLQVPFQWTPGFRLGMSHDLGNTPWDVVLYYTWYQTRGLSQAQVTTGEIHSSNLGNFFANNLAGNGLSGPYYHGAGIRWDLLLNTLDAELGYNFRLQEHYNFRPFVGIKGASINQAIQTSWQTPFDPAFKIPITTFSSATENISNDFWGLGPSVGLHSAWHVQEALALFGDFSGAFLWGHWHFCDIYQNNTPVTIAIQSSPFTTTATMASARLGLSWQGNLQNIDYVVRLSYEGQVWLNQLRYYAFVAGRQNNTLYLQGGTFDFCIHF